MLNKVTENVLLLQGLLDHATDPLCGFDDESVKKRILSLLRMSNDDPVRFEEALDALLESLLEGPEEEAVREILAELPSRTDSLRATATPSVDSEAIVTTEHFAEMAAGLEDDLGTHADTEEPAYKVVPVFFATDRAPTGKAEPRYHFSGNRGELQFGYVEVSIPDRHLRGRLEQPPWYLPLVTKKPQRHITLLGVTSLNEGQFADHLRQALVSAALRHVLIVIHGYNVSFEAAACRVAQLCHDFPFKGIPILYSWPSVGRWYRYFVDEANVESTEVHFCHSLHLIRSALQDALIHMMAHSMGNRLLREFVEHADTRTETRLGHLAEIVMAAPDIDAQSFCSTASLTWTRADHFTLYASSRDWALWLSKMFHGYPRAGDGGKRLLIIDGVETIDASQVRTGLFGHAYYGDAPSILTDIFLMLQHRLPAASRPGLAARLRDRKRYWHYLASK